MSKPMSSIEIALPAAAWSITAPGCGVSVTSSVPAFGPDLELLLELVRGLDLGHVVDLWVDLLIDERLEASLPPSDQRVQDVDVARVLLGRRRGAVATAAAVSVVIARACRRDQQQRRERHDQPESPHMGSPSRWASNIVSHSCRSGPVDLRRRRAPEHVILTRHASFLFGAVVEPLSPTYGPGSVDARLRSEGPRAGSRPRTNVRSASGRVPGSRDPRRPGRNAARSPTPTRSCRPATTRSTRGAGPPSRRPRRRRRDDRAGTRSDPGRRRCRRRLGHPRTPRRSR